MEPLTRQDFFDALTPLFVALHEKGLIDIAELPHFYEDALARRKLERGHTEADLVFLQGVVVGLLQLAKTMKPRPRE